MLGWQCWKWLSIALPPSPSALGTWSVPGDTAHLWGRGRLNNHPLHNPGTPNYVFQLYILGDMGHSGLWLSRNMALMGLSSAIWDSPSGNVIRTWQFGRSTELLKYLWKRSTGSWIMITLTKLPHFNHDILACEENFNRAAHYSFLGKSGSCRNPKSQHLLPAWC